MRMLVTGLLALSMVRGLHAQGPRATDLRPDRDSIDAVLRAEMRTRRIPGMQVAVVQHGQIVLLGEYGLANVEHTIPVKRSTVFPIGEGTAAFTGVAVMQLVEAGTLDLAAPVSRYLDGLPPAWQSVTVRQLLTHTSGLPSLQDASGRWLGDGDEAAAWAELQARPMASAPGARFGESRTDDLLLGRIIDKLGETSFDQFIAERQFRAVGMPATARSGFADSRQIVRRSAESYTAIRVAGSAARRAESVGHAFDDVPPFVRTAAGIHSTAEELAQWLIALQQGRLLKNAASLGALWTSVGRADASTGDANMPVNGYGLGWSIVTRPKHRAVGGVGGRRAAFVVYPDDDLAVVILTNLQGADPWSFIDGVASFFIPNMQTSNR